MDYQAVLFDMDGVLIDTEASVTQFWEALAAQYGVVLTQADFDRHIYGCPCRQTLDALFPNLTASQRQDVLTHEQAYETNMTYTAMRGVIALLRSLREHGIPTALVTSGERWKVDEVMRQLGIGELFATSVTADEIEQGKPHPACYLLAAQRLGVDPARCIVFEDSVSGAQAALAAGACCIGVRPLRMASALLTLGASHVIADFSGASMDSGEGKRLLLTGSPEMAFNLL